MISSIFITGLFIGLMIGVNLGAWLMRKAVQPLIDDHKKSSDYWYEQYRQAWDAYIAALTDMVERSDKMLTFLKKPIKP